MTEQNTPKMTHDEMIDTLKGLVFGTFDRTTAKEREALDMAIKALQKDIPIKVAKSKEPRFGMGYEYYDWVCPTCGWYLAPEPAIKNIPRRCGHCGQLLERAEE